MSTDNTETVTAPRDEPDVNRLSVAEAHRLVESGRGVLVDTRGRHHYDNAHAAGAVFLPLSAIEAANGSVRPDAVPVDRLLILYCA